MLQLLVTPNVVPSKPILLTLMLEAIHSFETSVLTRTIWRHIPEDGMLHSKHNVSETRSLFVFRWGEETAILLGLLGRANLNPPHLMT
jgi:hypothetical protein